MALSISFPRKTLYWQNQKNSMHFFQRCNLNLCGLYLCNAEPTSQVLLGVRSDAVLFKGHWAGLPCMLMFTAEELGTGGENQKALFL